MKYKQFDNLLGRKTEDNVIQLLKQHPMTCDEMADLTGLDRTTIHYQFKKLEIKKIIIGKGFGKIVYYGLTKEYRH